MVFNRLAVGLLAGITIPCVVDHHTYIFLSTCFLRPHIAFYEVRASRNKYKATPIEHIEHYVKDIFKAHLFFVLTAPLFFYQTWFLGKDFMDMVNEEVQVDPSQMAEASVENFKKAHAETVRQQTELAKSQGVSEEETKERLEAKRITFADYERYMDEMVAQGKLKNLEGSSERERQLAENEMRYQLDKQFQELLARQGK